VTFEVMLVAAAYLVGSVPTGLLIVRWLTGGDVRQQGSGNIGATNVLRAAGWHVGAAVTLIDMGKGALPVWLMGRVNPESAWIAAAMLAAVLGHCFPVWLAFRGGKGVATGFGAFLVIAPLSALAAFAVWLVVLAIGRWVALASMVASATFPIVLELVGHPDLVTLAAVSVAAVLIIVRHWTNLRDLVRGRRDDGGSE
jgi:glycerol-3-phosphate acyltransferase PlsY